MFDCVLKRLVVFSVLLWLGIQPLFSQTVTKATTPSICIGGSAVSLSDITIAETAENQFSSTASTDQLLIIAAPTNFQFEPSVGTITPTGLDLSNVSLTVTSSTATIKFDYTVNGDINSFVISGLKVKAVGQPSTGSLSTDPTGSPDITVALAGANYGDLTSELVVANVTSSSLNLCNGSSLVLNSEVATGGNGIYTYLWSPATALTDAAIYNPTANPTATITYTLTATDGNGCSGTNTVAVQVSDPIAITTQPTDQSVCSGNAVTFSVSATGNNLSYQWWEDNGGGFSMITDGGNYSGATSATLTISNLTNGMNGHSYQVVISTVGSPCSNSLTSSTAILTVNPVPVGTNTTNATVQSGAGYSLSPQTYITNSVTSTFVWVVNYNGLTGGAGNGTGSIVEPTTLRNFSSSVVNVVYTITPTSTTGLCAGNSFTVTVPIQNEPVGANATLAAICSHTLVNYDLLNSVGNNQVSRFEWIAGANTNVSGQSLTIQTGTIINDVLVNVSGVDQSIVYTITPYGTNGALATFTVTQVVNSAPTFTSGTLASVCSNTQFTINPQTNNNNPTPMLGNTFAWTASYPSGMTGGVGSGNGNIVETLINTSSGVLTATYTITPTGSNGCVGNSFTISQPIAPSPVVTNSVLTQSFCGNGTASFTPTINVASSTYSWTTTVTGTVSGVTATGSSPSVINDVLTNTSNTIATVQYQIKPMGPSGCEGSTVNFVVTVYPTPVLSLSPSATSSLCSGTATNITLNSPTANATVKLESVSYGMVTGGTLVALQTFTPGYKVAETLTNGTTSAQTVTYNFSVSANGCTTSGPFTATVVVNPNPTMTISNANAIICSGTRPNITLSSPTSGASISLQNVSYGSVMGGLYASGGTFSTGSVVNEGIGGLVNNTNNAITVTYTFGVSTPLTTPSCPLTIVPQSTTVQVLPAASFTLTNSTSTICSGSPVNIRLNSSVVGAQIRIKSVNYNGASGTLAAGNVYNDGQSITESISNTTSMPITVTYVFESIVGSCTPSSSQMTTVVVNPNPTMTAVNSSPIICSGTQTNIALNSPTTGAVISLQNVNYGSVTGGLYASGGTFSSGAVLTESAGGLVNNTNSTVIVTYTFSVSTPTTNPVCPTSSTTLTRTVQVLPTSTFSYTNSTPTICSGSEVNITLNTSVVGGVVRLKTVTYNGVTGTLTSGLVYSSGQKITEVLVNPSNVPLTVTYELESIVGSCMPSASQMTTVTVNPTPVFSITNNTPTVCEGSSVNIQLNSPTSNAVISLLDVNYNGVTGTLTSGAVFTDAQFISERPVTPFTIPTTITYTFKVDALSCSNTNSQQTTVSITKQPTVSLPANFTVCQSPSVALTGTIGGSALTGIWSLRSGSGTLATSNTSGNQVTANYSPSTADANNTVIFRLTTNDPDGSGACTPATRDISVGISRAAQVSAPSSLIVCRDVSTVSLNGSIGGATTSAVWSGGAGTFMPNANTPNASYQLASSEKNKTSVITVPLTLTAPDPDGTGPCTSVSTTTNLIINPLPFVFFTGLPNSLVQNGSPAQIFANQSGGSFAISPGSPALSNSLSRPIDQVTFDPTQAATGTYAINYTFTDANGCRKDTSRTVIVNPVTSVDFSINGQTTLSTGEIPLCANAGSFTLVPNVDITTGQPPTGFYSGSGPDSALFATHIVKSGVNYLINTNGLPSKSYSLTFVFKNAFGATSTFAHTVLVYPSPKPQFTTLNNCFKDTIQFQNNSTIDVSPLTQSNPVSYTFNFGDGSKNTYLYPTVNNNSIIKYKYGSAGQYSVTLTMTTDKGCTTTSAALSLNAGNPPIPTFTWSAICKNDSTKFVSTSNAGSFSTVTNLRWDFGDGTTITGMPSKKVINTASNNTSGTYSNPNHKYTANKVYSVTLTVDNSSGCNATSSVSKVFILDYITKNKISDSLYYENFEKVASNGGGWIPEVPNGYFATNATQVDLIKSDTSWVWSNPNGAVIQPIAQTGKYSWWTGKNSNSYFYYENSAINGPCLNLSKLKRPMIALDYWVNTDVNADGATLQYSVDGGLNWALIGPLAGLPTAQRNQGINWYPPGAIVTANPGKQPNFGPYGWTGGTQKNWNRGVFNLDMIPMINPLKNTDTLRKQVRFRIAFASKGVPSGNLHYDGFAFDNFFVGNKTKNVLIENFVNTNVALSLAEESSFSSLYTQQLKTKSGAPDFTYLQYHVRFPTPDPFSLTNADDASARALFYNVQQPPYSVLDGIQTGNFASGNYTTVDEVEIDRRSLRAPQITITQIDTIQTGSNNKINARIHLRADTTITFPIYANIALVEENDTLTVTGTKYTQIVRKLLYSGSGNTPAVKTLNPGDVMILSNPLNGGETVLNCKISDPAKLKLIAWVQNIDPLKRNSQEIVQSFVSPIKLTSKRNGVITGIENTKAPIEDLILYPNPAESKFNLALAGDFPEGCIWKIADQSGVYIMSGDFNDAFNGKKTISINLQSGVYIVSVAAPNQTPVYRRLVVLNSN